MHLNGNNGNGNGNGKRRLTRMTGNELMSHPLLPPGFYLPSSRRIHPSKRLRELLRTEAFVVSPEVGDPTGAQLAMYHGFKAVYVSRHSFAMAHLGTTDMDLCSAVETADTARRMVSALRKFQLAAAVGDAEKDIPPQALHIPPLVVNMDAGQGDIFSLQRGTELYVGAGVAGAQIEDQVLSKGSGHKGKALIPASEVAGTLKMARLVADDCGNSDFLIFACASGELAVNAPESLRGLDLAIERALRYLETGIPDVLSCEFPASDRAPVERFCWEVRKRFPKAIFAFRCPTLLSDSESQRLSELGELGMKFIFIAVGAQHTYGMSELVQSAAEREAWGSGAELHGPAYLADEHYRQLVAKMFDAERIGKDTSEERPKEEAV